MVKNGFKGQIVCTTQPRISAICFETVPIFRSLKRSGEIEKARRSGEPLYEPLYTMQDTEMQTLAPIQDEQRISMQGWKCVFTDILDICLALPVLRFELHRRGAITKIVFSGDVGNINQPIIKDPETDKRGRLCCD